MWAELKEISSFASSPGLTDCLRNTRSVCQRLSLPELILFTGLYSRLVVKPGEINKPFHFLPFSPGLSALHDIFFPSYSVSIGSDRGIGIVFSVTVEDMQARDKNNQKQKSGKFHYVW